MNIFKSITLKWWQGSLFKISILSLGIAIGASWPNIFLNWVIPLTVLFAVLVCYIGYVWWKQ